jgi:hypothetical protein
MLGEIKKLPTALNTSNIPDRKAERRHTTALPGRRAAY